MEYLKLPRINLNFRLLGMNVVSGIDFLNEVMGKIEIFFIDFSRKTTFEIFQNGIDDQKFGTK